MHCIPKVYQSIIEKPMAKKNKLFQRTDQNTPQTKHRKKNDVVKKEQQLSNSCRF